MRFGIQCGPNAQAQIKSAIASKLIGRIRFACGHDQSQPSGFSIGFTNALVWCKANGTIPHIIIGETPSPQNWWNWYQSFIRPLFDWVWAQGIIEASFEVGNEFDVHNTLDPTATSTQDILFRDYKQLYKQCANALIDFISTHPTAQYTIGGAAAATGMAFTSRLLTWCRANRIRIDFASCHYYGLGTPVSIMRDEIRMIKGICDIPVWLTEVGYDSDNGKNSSPEAVNWIKEMFNGSMGNDEIFWQIHCSDNGSGIWYSDGTITPMGKPILDYRKAIA